MNAAIRHPTDEPAPKSHEMKLHEGFFAIFGGPLAWFIQLNAGFALASEPCFRDGMRLVVPVSTPDWTWAAMLAIIAIAFIVAVGSAILSWRVYLRTEDEGKGDHRHVMEVGSGRTRFLALWGVFLGGGASIATLLTLVGFWVLPRCAG
jgi:hypothetical protein